jgi:hypothetical protein
MTGADACETRLQSLILARLMKLEDDGAKIHAWRANTGAARTAGGRTIKFGEPGQADIQAVVRGLFVAIEVKSATGRVSSAQDKWAGAIQIAGGTYILARCLEDALEPVMAMLGAP